MSVLKQIQPKIFQLTEGLFANWMPPDHVEVGDYGSVRKERFLREGSLRDDIAVEVEELKKADGKFEYQDSASLKVVSSASTNARKKRSASGAIEAGVSITFSGQGAFLYHLCGLNQCRLKDARTFYTELGQKLITGAVSLEDDFVLVTEVRVADKSTIIVSENREGTLELQTDFQPGGQAFLAGLRGEISVTSSRGNFFKWLAQNSSIPLIRLVRPVFGDGPGGSPNPLLSQFIAFIRGALGPKRLEIEEVRLEKYAKRRDGVELSYAVPGITNLLRVGFKDVALDEFMNYEEGFGTVPDFVFSKAEAVAVREAARAA